MTSQINPNNIDGTYPVAGQPNNTQGMRDNFTATKTNFQYASDEINDLQSKVVLKSALTGSTLDNNMNGALITAVKLNNVSYTYTAITTTSGTVNIDYTAAGFQQINPSGNISLNFTNWPTSGIAGTVRVGINVTDTTYTVTLPAVVTQGLIGLQGVNPGTPGVSNTITFGAVGNYAFEFVTIDGGLNVWIFDDSRPADVFSSPVMITSTEDSTSTSSGALVVSGGVGIDGNLYVGGTIVGNITVTGINVSGNATAGNFIASGTITSVGNIVGGNINTAGRVTATGNVTGGNINATGLSLSGNVISALNITGNVAGGNIRSVGILSASGNITGGNIVTVGSLSTAGSLVNSSVTTTGNVSATGNVHGGNIVTTGNVYADYVQATNFGSTGNVEIEAGSTYWYFNTDDSFTGNGLISVSGNVTGGNLKTGGITSAAGNVTGGNVLTGGLISAAGNVTGGNVLTGGLISATGNITTPASFSGNVVGRITNPVRNAGAMGGGTLTLDFTSDSVVRATYDTTTFTVAFSNYIAGRKVTLILNNISGAGRTFTTGVSADRATNNDTTPSVAAGRLIVIDYYSVGTDSGNVFAAVHYN